jgi:hypothetical protein
MRAPNNEKRKTSIQILRIVTAVLFVSVSTTPLRDAQAQTDPILELETAGATAAKFASDQIKTTADALAAYIKMQQANRDQVSTVTANTSGAYVMKGSYCAIGKLPQTMASLKQAKLSLQQAIESVLFWAKNGAKDNPNSKIHFYNVLCQMSLVPKSTACPSPSFPQYANTGVFSGAAVQRGPYKFPADVFIIDQYNHASLQGAPSVGDMPFLQAMFSCLYKRGSTNMAEDPNGTRIDEANNPSVIPQMMDDYEQQAAVNSNPAYQHCINDLVNNTIIGTDAPQGLQQFRIAVAQAAHYMNPSYNGTGHMSAATATNCETGTGCSPADIYRAFRFPDPARLGVAAQEGDDDHLHTYVGTNAIEAAKAMVDDN